MSKVIVAGLKKLYEITGIWPGRYTDEMSLAQVEISMVRKSISIFTLLCVIFCISPYFPASTYALDGECKSVTCFDGSVHPCGFDCTTLLSPSTPSSSGTRPAARDWETIRREQKSERRLKARQRWEQELERRRQEQNNRQKLEETEEKARREQFEKDKQEALKMLNSGARALGESGSGPKLKIGTSPGLTLKEPLFSKGYKGSAPPYLADLDPKWPIVIEPKKVEGGTPEALRKANRRTHVLLDALEAGEGNWEASISYLQNRLAASPRDLVVRDTLNYVRGLYRGYLNAKNVGDHYFKYGVRHWIEQDYDSAARAFGLVVRENPDDIAAYRTFAYTLGLRDGKSQCGRSVCRHIDAPKKSTFDFYQSSVLQKLRRDVARNPRALQQRALLNLWEGMAAYEDYVNLAPKQKPKPLAQQAQNLVNQGMKKFVEKDYVSAMHAFAEAYKVSDDERGVLFMKEYSGGLAAAQRGESVDEPWDPRMKKAYDELMELWENDIKRDFRRMVAETGLPSQQDYQSLQEVLKDVDNRNPFFGVLPSKKVKRLKEEHMI
jgi:tetratricopeptide (TPR) repeat protein